jgi:nucleotide-binding universal stress UspA family protein
VDEASERKADVIICGLPFRRRFGGDFTIGRTIPYILKNAPCGVWVIREAMPEEQT